MTNNETKPGINMKIKACNVELREIIVRVFDTEGKIKYDQSFGDGFSNRLKADMIMSSIKTEIEDLVNRKCVPETYFDVNLLTADTVNTAQNWLNMIDDLRSSSVNLEEAVITITLKDKEYIFDKTKESVDRDSAILQTVLLTKNFKKYKNKISL